MTTALTLSGSIRTGSFNQKLQAAVGEKLKSAGVEVNAISLKDYELPIFNEDIEKAGVPDNVLKLAELFKSHDIVFIATPEYNGGLPPLLVNTIAWVSRQKPSPFKHAVYGLGGVSSGKYGTLWAQSHLRDILGKMGTLVAPTLLGVGPSSQAFNEDGTLAEVPINAKVDQLVLELTKFSRGGI